MKDKSKILQSTGKRKRALPEGNPPGIACSTGLVKERKVKANLSFYRPNQEQNALIKLIFILLIGPKNGGAYTSGYWPLSPQLPSVPRVPHQSLIGAE
jgi:hypothetical protein